MDLPSYPLKSDPSCWRSCCRKPRCRIQAPDLAHIVRVLSGGKERITFKMYLSGVLKRDSKLAALWNGPGLEQKEDGAVGLEEGSKGDEIHEQLWRTERFPPHSVTSNDEDVIAFSMKSF